MLKVMLKLPLKQSSPPVILCKMMGSASASSSGKATIDQVLQDSRQDRLTLTFTCHPMSGKMTTHEAKK